MERQKRFAVIGSDARQLAAGRALARAGYAVEGPEEIALADYILLPLPLDAARTPLAELLRAARPGALALGGMLSEEAKAIAAEAGVELVDYFAREELAIRNAIPTAEGVHRRFAGPAQTHPVGQRGPAAGIWPGGAGGWHPAGGIGGACDSGSPPPGPAGTGGKPGDAGGGAGPAGPAGPGL